jgi:hypoxanthine phosphoribosyltransferase
MEHKIVVTATQISEKLNDIANKIAEKYRGQRLLIIGILKGGFMVTADLSRLLWEKGLTDSDVDFLGISSYGAGTESSRSPEVTYELQAEVTGRPVLIVEDIVDTGHSLKKALEIIRAKNPASIETFSLLSKPSRREIEVPVEYIGFEVEGWIEGYGLDAGRNCPNVLERINP